MQKENKCVHCGADCGKNPIVWNNLKFCCNGCKSVYQILNQNKLYRYYEFDDSPGIKVETEELGDKYAFLDKEEIQEKIFEFVEDDFVKVTFYVPVIHCAACIWLLENLHTLNKGVISSITNFTKKEVTINFDKSKISLRQLVELLVSLHYVPEITLDKKDDSAQKKSNKKLLLKIGIAGFAFGNIMLYSLPDYFNEYFNGKPLEDSLSRFLNILNFVLLLPTVFYSGNDYLISAYKSLQNKVSSIDFPIALGITVLFLITAFQIFTDTGQGYSDSLAGLIFFLLLGKWYQARTYKALSFDRDYKSYFPIAVTKIYNNKEDSILLSEVKKDDILLIRNNELIPADSELLEGIALIDYSFVTGESAPVVKNKSDFIYAGGKQTSGIIKVKVIKDVKQSHLTQLWNQKDPDSENKKTLKSVIDRISKYFTISVISIALLGFIFWAIFGQFRDAIFVFSAVLIIACPCALALSIPFTFGNTMRIFSRKGFYIKNINVIERMTKIDTIVFDKTGTITKPDEDSIKFIGNELNKEEIRAVFSISKQSTHPLSYALTRFYQDVEYIEPEHFIEMSGRGTYGEIGNLKIKLGSAEYTDADTNFAKVQNFGKVKNTNDNFDKVKKQSIVYLSINENIRGYYTINNKYREGFSQVINNLQENFDLHLLSGDNNSELDNLKKYFDVVKINFNQKPQDKKNYIKKLQEKGKKVLMIGDGLNDAGALIQSDVALSISDDVYHFSPAGDAILQADNFDNLSKFINFTKTSLKVVHFSFLLSFSYNIIGIIIALSGILSPVIAAILMPISSISVIAFATFTTSIFGLKLKSQNSKLSKK